MLIHRMSQTFQTAIAAGPTDFAFMKAQRVISMQHEPPTPAPLYLLSLPTEAVRAALWLLSVCQSLFEPNKSDNPPPEANSNEADVPSVDRLEDTVTRYILNYQSNDVQVKHWLTKIGPRPERGVKSAKVPPTS